MLLYQSYQYQIALSLININIIRRGKHMEVFIALAKEPNKISDLKETFDVVAKFNYPEPSEVQKSNYFEEKFDFIFSKFYTYLKSVNFFVGQNESQIAKSIKDGIEFSEVMMKFDSWLDDQSNIFTFEQKSKSVPPPVHNIYPSASINSQSNKYGNTQNPPNAKYFQISKVSPYNIEKHTNSPVPSHKQQTTNSAFNNSQKNVNNQQKGQNYKHQQAAQEYANVSKQAQNNRNNDQYVTNHPPKHVHEDKEKGSSNRFYQKLGEFFDCPERAYIIRGQISGYVDKNKSK